jgi:hypothetical protein
MEFFFMAIAAAMVLLLAAALSLLISWTLSVGILYNLKPGNHPIVWAVLTILSLAWCVAAIWTAKNIVEAAVDVRTQSFGTWQYNVLAAPIMLVSIPAWLVLLGPSFAVLFTVLTTAPERLRAIVQRIARPVAARMADHPRVYIVSGVLISLAAAFRAYIWLATMH